MNKPYKKISLVSLLLLSQFTTSHTSFAVEAVQSKSTVIKSINDTRNYQVITLDNGIEVLLASDPTLAETAVSLTVGVGSYQDPISQPGLAHYLEHMIFMGSEKHPQANAMMNFIKANNGVVNAMTESEQTTYLFKINSEQLSPALSLFTDAIKAPLFKLELSNKEITAIDQEWQRARQTDGYAINRTNSLTTNPHHPVRKFSAGNLSSLGDKKGSDLNKEMQKFYQQYYSANIMKLALVGDKPLTELEKIAKQYFSDIPNKKINRPSITVDAYDQNSVEKNIFLKTKVATDTLMLQFPLTSNKETWQYKPNKYIEYLLSSQEKGTLAATLTEKGLIDGMLPMFMPDTLGKDGSAMVMFVLTEQGKSQKEAIISSFYQYIELIKTKGVNQQYAAEFSSMLSNQFDNFQNPDALSLAMSFSRKMLSIPTKDVLHYNTYYSGFQEAPIQNVLAQLTPNRMRIWHISDNQKTNTSLTYANGSYRIEPLTKNQSIAYQRKTFDINLPAYAKAEQADRKMELTADFTSPKQVLSEQGIEAWLMNSQNFSANQGLIAVSLENPLFQKDLKHHVLTNTLLVMLSKDLQRLATRAQQRHQVYMSAQQNDKGNISVTLAGKASQHEKYTHKFFAQLSAITLDDDALNNAKKLYIESLNNVEKAPLRNQAELLFSQTMKSSAMLWDIDQTVAAAQSLTLTDITKFHHALLGSSYVDLFAFGKYDSQTVKAIAHDIRSQLGETNLPVKPTLSNNYQPKVGSMINKKIDISLDNVFLKDTYIYPIRDEKTAAQLQVLNKLFESSLFNELRTNKQMAYEIGSYQENIHQYPAFSLFIQSSNTDLPTLKSSFNNFIVSFYLGLKEVDEKTINQVATTLISKLEQKPENIYVEAKDYLNDWSEQQYDFSSKQRRIANIKDTTKADILRLYQTLLIDGDSENIVVQLRGKKQKSQSFYTIKSTAKTSF